MSKPNRHLERVWEPIQLGPHTIKHRIVMTPHGVGWDGSNIPRERHVAYWAERAKGGCALVQVGATAVYEAEPDPRGGPSVASDRRTVPLYQAMADAIHAHDAKVFVELAEGGVHGRSRSATGIWNPPLGVSQMPSVTVNDIPEVITKDKIRAIQRAYVGAVTNLMEAGIDGATLHAAHSYLLGQFMSPAYNFRDDEYGGSTRNRCRFLIEAAEQVRDAVGTGIAIGVRLSYDEYIGDAGITPDMSDEYVSILSDTGLFDWFDISTGGYHSGERFVPPNVLPLTHIAHYAKRARDIIDGRAVVIMAHKVRTVELAEKMLEEGVTDLVGMTRAHMADPYLVTKAREGRSNEVQRCVGTNECVYNSHMLFRHACTVNPINGREGQWGEGKLPAIQDPTRVAVVGGGPAGLRFAATAARRGVRVELFERDETLGGHIKALASLPLHQTWAEMIEDLEASARRAGAALNLGVEVSAGMLQQGNYDSVVVATGCRWDSTGLSPVRPGRGIPGLESHPVVLTFPEAVKRLTVGSDTTVQRVLIVDETGAYLALGLSEWFLTNGAEVTIVSRRNVIGEVTRETWEYPLFMQRTKGLPLSMYANALVSQVEGNHVTIQNLWGSDLAAGDYDWIVLCGLRFSEDSLAEELRGLGVPVHVIGDARAPRRTADAIYEGEKLARSIEPANASRRPIRQEAKGDSKEEI